MSHESLLFYSAQILFTTTFRPSSNIGFRAPISCYHFYNTSRFNSTHLFFSLYDWHWTRQTFSINYIIYFYIFLLTSTLSLFLLIIFYIVILSVFYLVKKKYLFIFS